MKAFSALAVAFAIMLAQPASANTIFSDGFNRETSNTVGNFWTETESASSSVSIVHVTGAAGDNQLKLQGSLGNNTWKPVVSNPPSWATAASRGAYSLMQPTAPR